MPVTLSNDFIIARIKEKGAELESLFHKELQLEYIWNADPKFWAKSSPVLFPIVGQVKSDSYFYKKEKYSLPRHGFARDQNFEIESQSSSEVVFLLKSSAETKAKYPFDFELRIIYKIYESSLSVGYSVSNTSSDEMLFSIGAHPAFKVPLTSDTTYSDYFLEFNQVENSPRWNITSHGQIAESEPFLRSTKILPLNKNLFAKDALVFKDLKSTSIHIRCSKHSHGIDFEFDGFPYFGIWAAPGADFVCLEPWCGIADSIHHSQEFESKEGIQKIQGGNKWTRTWKITCL